MWKYDKVSSKGEYIYAIVKDHPKATDKGYVLEHRVVMENHIGRLLSEDEIIHHKDHNKRNNDISNLEITNRADHNKHHNLKNRMADLVCANCGVDFQRKWNQRPEAKGQKQAFCSRSCNGKFQRRQQIASIA